MWGIDETFIERRNRSVLRNSWSITSQRTKITQLREFQKGPYDEQPPANRLS
jgi:hypothetical protein